METIVAIFQIDFQNSWWNLIEGFIDMGNSIPWIDVWCNTGSNEQNFQNFHRCFVVRFITFRFVHYLVGMAWLGSKESVRARKWTYTQKGTHMVLVYFCNRSCAMHAAHMYAKSKMLGFSLRSSFCFLAQIEYIWCQLIWISECKSTLTQIIINAMKLFIDPFVRYDICMWIVLCKLIFSCLVAVVFKFVCVIFFHFNCCCCHRYFEFFPFSLSTHLIFALILLFDSRFTFPVCSFSLNVIIIK